MAYNPKSLNNLKIPKKGDPSPNPKGKPKQHISKTFARINRDFIELKITEYLRKHKSELQEILKDENREALDHFLSAVILKGIYDGDHKKLAFLFDRLVGKVVDKIEYTPPKPFVLESHDSTKTVEMGMSEDKTTIEVKDE